MVRVTGGSGEGVGCGGVGEVKGRVGEGSAVIVGVGRAVDIGAGVLRQAVRKKASRSADGEREG